MQKSYDLDPKINDIKIGVHATINLAHNAFLHAPDYNERMKQVADDITNLVKAQCDAQVGAYRALANQIDEILHSQSFDGFKGE